MAPRSLAPFVLAATTLAAAGAHADEPTSTSHDRGAATAQQREDAARNTGVAVVCEGPHSEAADALAREVYRSPLRPPQLREDEARVLVGGPPSKSADLEELAQLRRGLSGRDAAARAVAAQIARRLHVEALVVVRTVTPADATAAPRDEASLFLTASQTFDAALYAPDLAPSSEPQAISWSGTVKSLARTFGHYGDTGRATHSAVRSSEPSREAPKAPFYKSPWLWGAIGAAALLGGGVFLATRGSSSDTVDLDMEIPR